MFSPGTEKAGGQSRRDMESMAWNQSFARESARGVVAAALLPRSWAAGARVTGQIKSEPCKRCETKGLFLGQFLQIRDCSLPVPAPRSTSNYSHLGFWTWCWGCWYVFSPTKHCNAPSHSKTKSQAKQSPTQTHPNPKTAPQAQAIACSSRGTAPGKLQRL